MTSSQPAPPGPLDSYLAAACGIAALALYAWTLQPGLGGPEDTPKFQYLGYVLGTAHSPGYPLYTIATHLFSYVPLGSIAYRMNLFSAVCGAATVVAAWHVTRELGASRIASTAAALGLATGQYFWWNAILAEVYTLGTALQAWMVAWLLAWARTRRRLALHAAVACAALALGNHLSIVTVAPAAILFVLLVDARGALRPATLAVNLLIGVAGLAQYAFIVIRTYQGGPYLESRASNLAELLAVIRADRFSGQVFAFTLDELLTKRVPEIARHLQHDMSVPGLLLGMAGLAWLARRRPAGALLVGLGALGPLWLTLNVAADVKGFLMPVLAMAWPAAGVGLHAIGTALSVVAPRRLVLVTTAVAAAALPASALARNFEANNLRGATYDGAYFEALLAQSPPRAAFIAEEYVVDSMLAYQSIVSERAPGDVIRALPRVDNVVSPLIEEGYVVRAFREGASAMLQRGFVPVPATLEGPPLRQVLDRLPADATIYGAAVMPGLPVGLSPRDGPALAAWRSAQARMHHVLAARPGRWDEAIIESADGPIDRRFGRDQHAGGFAHPAAVRLVAEGERAEVVVNERVVAVAEPGLTLVAVGTSGAVIATWTYPPGAPLTTGFDMARRPLYTIGARSSCAAVGDGAWHDVSALTTGGALLLRFDNAKRALATLALFAAGDAPLAPTVEAELGTNAASVMLDVYDRTDPEARSRLTAAAASAGAPLPPETAGRFVTAVRVAVDDGGDSAVSRLSLGGLPRHVVARGAVDRRAGLRLVACPVSLPRVMGTWVPGRAEVWMGPSASHYFGHGWRSAERAGPHSRPWRWTGARESRLYVPLDAAEPLRIRLRLQPAPGVRTMALSLNGRAVGTRPLVDGWQEITWETGASAWRTGVNELVLSSEVHAPAAGTPETGARGVQVERIRLERTSG